ncbi:unnamed protein product, partial [Symbiodinium necroappetens]
EYHRVEEAVEEVAPAPEMQPVQTLPAPCAEHVEVLPDALVETSEPRNLEADAQLAQDWLAPAEHPAPVEEFPVESTRQPAAQEQGLEMPVEQSNGHDREVFEGAMPQPPVHANGGPGHVEEPEEPPEEAGPLPDLAANGRETHEVPEEAPPLQFEAQRVEQRSEPGEVGQLRADYEAEQRLPRQLKPKVRELLRDIRAFQYPRRRNIQHEIREKEIRPPSRQSPIPRTQRTLVEELSLMEPSPVKARLMGAVQQIAHLQARIEELESEAAVAKDVELQLSEKMGCMTMQLTEAQAARQQAEAASAQLQREADQLRQEASAASERARVQAAEASDAALGQVREEMERELEHLLKQKDEQLRAIESKFAASERSRQNATRDLEALTHEADALKQELEQLHSDSAGRTSDHERSVEQLTADYQKQIAELEERRDIEERQKHELALNLRSVEERSRSELAQLEAQKTQLELQSGVPAPGKVAKDLLHRASAAAMSLGARRC